MSPRLKSALTLVGSLALAAGLLAFALRGVSWPELQDATSGAAWGWLLPLAAVGLASHALRAWRWQFLLDAVPPDGPVRGVGFGDAFASVLIGYLVNQAAPRLGEVARAGNLARRTGVSAAAAMGTVVAERVLDVLSLGVALLLTVALFGARLTELLGSMWAGVVAVASGFELPSAALWGGLVAGSALLIAGSAWAWRRWGRGRLGALAAAFRDGLLSVVRARRRVALFATTVAIWGLYGLSALIPIHMLGLDDAFGLGLAEAWAVMTLGAVGMSVPSPGGTGTYHVAAVQALTGLFAVAAAPAAAYAVVTHAAQVALMSVSGAAALAWQAAVPARRAAARTGPDGRPAIPAAAPELR